MRPDRFALPEVGDGCSVLEEIIFQNEVVWKRTSAHNDPGRFGRIHDTLFYYVKGEGATWNIRNMKKHDPNYIEKNSTVIRMLVDGIRIGDLTGSENTYRRIRRTVA